MIIGEGHREVLFHYVESALSFYKNRITPRPLPLLLNGLEVFQSHLLFPGKICMVKSKSIEDSVSDCSKEESTYMAVSDTGHHRILIISLQGEIKVGSVFYTLMHTSKSNKIYCLGNNRWTCTRME